MFKILKFNNFIPTDYRQMKKRATFNYYQRIKNLLPVHTFKTVEKRLCNIPNNEMEALWNILSAGYPVDFALTNYKSVYEHTTKNRTTYSNTLSALYSIYPGLMAGIRVKDTEWFELN